MIDLRETFHSISLKRKIYFDELLLVTELNLMEVEILVFLKESQEDNTFTGILKGKDFAKSYVSKAITHLVQEEYLHKVASSTNKKVYRLYLLDKSDAIIEAYYDCVRKFRQEAFADISEDELEVFEKVMKKISDNLTER